jgi:hypothetical protein
MVAVIRFRHCKVQVSDLAEEGFIVRSGSLGESRDCEKRKVYNGERTGGQASCDLFPTFSQELLADFHVNLLFALPSRGEFAVNCQ